MVPLMREGKPRLGEGGKPFILLDDARGSGAQPGRLYRQPVEVIEARKPEEVLALLDRLRAAGRAGLHAAGFLSYEAGHALEPRLAPLASPAAPEGPPLGWFGLFEGVDEVEAGGLLPSPAGAWAGSPRPLVDQEDYEAAVARARDHIGAGDIYQANLTFPAEVPVAGDPLALYAAIRPRARAGHGGIVFTGSHWILSFSPELFFTVDAEGRITTRPMKGTAARTTGKAEDAAAAAALREDPKQRAENLMIVDLLRNDLARVCRTGSVKVPSLFEIETYPTVRQMTSTVVGEIAEGLVAVDLLRTIFPCGSVTGAPKIRAMEIIAALETAPRSVYTGSIGSIAPDGSAAFNVAIRTLVRHDGQASARIGLGSGIVWDSRPVDEWRECLAKGRFVAEEDRRFDLIETMRFDPHEGVVELERHLERMKASAAALGFAFDRHAARNDLQAATFRLRAPRKIRLLLSRSGSVAIEGRPLPVFAEDPVQVAVVPLPVASGDFRLRHKTTDRAFCDAARRASGRAEVVFEDEEGFLTEGSFTNIFVERKGRLLTPPLRRGLLPGVLRASLIEEGDAEEADLTTADLSNGFFIGNAVRGLTPAIVVQ